MTEEESQTILELFRLVVRLRQVEDDTAINFINNVSSASDNMTFRYTLIECLAFFSEYYVDMYLGRCKKSTLPNEYKPYFNLLVSAINMNKIEDELNKELDDSSNIAKS